jgi:predicted ferric reductase
VTAGLIAFVGFLILVMLTVGPRLPVLHRVLGISYRSWRHTHKFIGIFFIMSVAHMVLVKPLATDEAFFWDEIHAMTNGDDSVRVHLVASARDGRLTAEDIDAASRGRLRDKDVYLCGPVPMITSLQRGLRRVGVRASAIHFEEFSFR